MTPTARTLAALRSDGYTPAVVEAWIPRLNIRRDLFGVGDVLAVRPGTPPLLIQCTTGDHHSNRVNKAKSESRLRAWLQSGATFEVWSWSKRDDQWECRKTPLVLDEIDIRAIEPPRQRQKHEENLFTLNTEPIEMF